MQGIKEMRDRHNGLSAASMGVQFGCIVWDAGVPQPYRALIKTGEQKLDLFGDYDFTNLSVRTCILGLLTPAM